ncbi:hypothetical protein [Terricaulis sp.]|uniref:hypothetical protein n=1 Tax=Terricaulis sp. TaxID=2768686 RepID=UPI003783DA98
MAEREGSGSAPWIAFLAGIVLVAIVAVGYFAYSGQQPQEQAKLEMNVPDVNVNPPDINLPPPPQPATPPTADQAAPADQTAPTTP